MKTLKKYTTPKMEIIETEMKAALLAGSGEDIVEDIDDIFPGQHGRDNACQHGHHKWFCD
jgi:hypothetical protein